MHLTSLGISFVVLRHMQVLVVIGLFTLELYKYIVKYCINKVYMFKCKLVGILVS